MASSNSGKRFEDNFKKSVPDYCYCHRLKDSSQSFIDSGLSDFSWQNPCDFYLFDTKNRIFYANELKSSKQKYITFENIDEELMLFIDEQDMNLQQYNDMLVRKIVQKVTVLQHDKIEVTFMDGKKVEMFLQRIQTT